MSAKRNFFTTLTMFSAMALFGSLAHANEVKNMDVTIAPIVTNQDDCVDVAVDGALALYHEGLLDGNDIHDAIDILYKACID